MKMTVISRSASLQNAANANVDLGNLGKLGGG
jgi:hypothetical protein